MDAPATESTPLDKEATNRHVGLFLRQAHWGESDPQGTPSNEAKLNVVSTLSLIGDAPAITAGSLLLQGKGCNRPPLAFYSKAFIFIYQLNGKTGFSPDGSDATVKERYTDTAMHRSKPSAHWMPVAPILF